MSNKPLALFFDKNDYQLLSIVNDVLERGPKNQALRSLLEEYMHPHGIKEMAAPRGLRIAYAIAGLLGSFEKGKASDRIKALRALRDEVILSSPIYYQKNTSRVLLQIMKELVRSKDNQLRQLKLAHDFRMASTGNPRRVRSELAKYHLIEMPEEWNQLAFDDHVHDANTKGRKSPSHLLMDAWIKGIRYLTVVYYNFVRPEVVEELIEASSILDIRVQVGIEFSVRFRNKYARFTWEPSGFDDNSSFLRFLREEAVVKLMESGRNVSRYQQRYVFDVLREFNERHRLVLERKLGNSLPRLSLDEFMKFVGDGQPSLLHLARFIHHNAINRKRSQVSLLCEKRIDSSGSGTGHSEEISVETILNDFLLPARNPGIKDPHVPEADPNLPGLLQSKLSDLLSRLLTLNSGSKFTLNLSNLSAQDTLELLFASEGKFSHIETFSLKNDSRCRQMSGCIDTGHDHKNDHDRESIVKRHHLIAELQKAINDHSVIHLKRAIRAIVEDYEQECLLSAAPRKLTEEPEADDILSDGLPSQLDERKTSLLDILTNLQRFHHHYRNQNLLSRIGSGSTGLAELQHGMGFLVIDTLPARMSKTLYQTKGKKGRLLIPATALLTQNSHRSLYDRAVPDPKTSSAKRLISLRKPGGRQWSDWSLDGIQIHAGKNGNIAALGGLNKNGDNEPWSVEHEYEETISEPWKYLNTNLKNTFKALTGFIPAFFAFYLTKNWWVLAWFGAFIWFGITGSRNIIQSILGGGGLRRSPLLPWNSLISWSRISDSLLYTGFSVPLLDYLIKTVFLDRALDITAGNNPILLYSVMGLANGIYISGHNMIRGLPKGATIGNFFRSIMAIPVAILLNGFIGALLVSIGISDVGGILQKWAAILSKLSSDCVAAFIEGFADRQSNIEERLAAYRTKIAQVYAVFSQLDMCFPEQDVITMMESPKTMMKTLSSEAQKIEKLLIVNALDLLYFWMYQPRARKALTSIARGMSQEEWLIFFRSQLVLKRHKEISQILVDGLVGKKFGQALSFYLARSNEYLSELKKIGDRHGMVPIARIRDPLKSNYPSPICSRTSLPRCGLPS
ncbi:MAG: hypothetical protein IH612_06840 [Desulfofustis sp.]|nr:hypothetical protein [Desulfofustis sp.]